MFNGLGINEELLLILKELDIKYIKVPFCDEVLETTTDKWLREGVRSPYCSDKVDQQLILRLDKITFDQAEHSPIAIHNDEQLSLWRA